MVGTMGVLEVNSTPGQLIVMIFIIVLVIAIPMQLGYLINVCPGLGLGLGLRAVRRFGLPAELGAERQPGQTPNGRI